MSAYNGPKCRLCRSAGVKLFLKGAKCESPQCPVTRRQSVPGQRRKTRAKYSDFALHLREKQKVKRIYLLTEAQLRNYFGKSLRKLGNTGEFLLSLLERRADNVIVRAGLAASRSEARQLLRHHHFKINNQRVDVPSYQVKVGDLISFDAAVKVRDIIRPAWLSLSEKDRVLKVVGLPKRDDVAEGIEEQLIVEFYSR